MPRVLAQGQCPIAPSGLVFRGISMFPTAKSLKNVSVAGSPGDGVTAAVTGWDPKSIKETPLNLPRSCQQPVANSRQKIFAYTSRGLFYSFLISQDD